MIIKAFNYTFFIVIGLMLAVILGVYLVLKNKSEKIKIYVLSGISIFNAMFFFLYKYWLSKDPEFLTINNLEFFNWWAELPLQLCNISMFMIPLGLFLKNDFIKSYCFFISPIAALMALCFPEPAFTNSDIFLLRNIGFYSTHILIIVCGILIVPLKLYRPTYKGIINPIITLFILAFILFIFNTIVRKTVCPEANYFFTYQTELPILSTFYKILPVPFLYEFFILFIIGPYCLFVVWIFNLIQKIKKEKNNNVVNQF